MHDSRWVTTIGRLCSVVPNWTWQWLQPAAAEKMARRHHIRLTRDDDAVIRSIWRSKEENCSDTSGLWRRACLFLLMSKRCQEHVRETVLAFFQLWEKCYPRLEYRKCWLKLCLLCLVSFGRGLFGIDVGLLLGGVLSLCKTLKWLLGLEYIASINIKSE